MSPKFNPGCQALLAALIAGVACEASAADPAKVKEAVDAATDAYVYGNSLETTDVMRIQMSNMPKLEELKGPPNQFINVKHYPPTDYRGVSAPNADTLYSVAWVDLSEPQVFSHPDMGKRYFLFASACAPPRRVLRDAVSPSTIRLKRASTITEIRRQQGRRRTAAAIDHWR